MRRWVAGVASILVAVALATSSVASCLGGSMTVQNAEMACCKAGHHTCHKSGSPADCCKKSASPQSQWTLTKASPLHAPVRTMLAACVTAVYAALAQSVRHNPASDSSPPSRVLGPPLYIAFASLLI